LPPVDVTLPDASALYRVIDRTWPPAHSASLGPWTIRTGMGGGKRVSAATAEAAIDGASIAQAEQAMTGLGQSRLFMVRQGEGRLDEKLQARGYSVVDPVSLYAAPVSTLTAQSPPPMSAFPVWPALAIMAELWDAGGIGPERRAVMQRAGVPKTAILARHADQPAGVAFVAIHGDIAMIHAIEVSPAMRRNGVGGNILRHAARWAQDQGAAFLSLAVTRANSGANTLYASLGLSIVGNYHYRTK